MNYFQKQHCATEFLRNVLNYFWKQSEDIVTQIEADKEPLAVSSSGIAEDKKKEVILYYVVGSTIHSACGRKKRNGVNEQLVLNTLALSGIESKDIYPYIGVLIPNVVSWILKQNRGGLTFATIQTFELFKLINEKLEPFYGRKYFKSQKENKERKNSIKDVLNVNLEIQELWHKILDSNPKVCKDKKFRDKIFHRLIESFCKLRGKGLTLFLRGKHFSGKMHKSTPGLRKGLKKKLES